MSNKGTAFQKGGGGTNYEQVVGTAFTVTMLTNGIVPCIPDDAQIIEISFQTSNRGYETDDILVIAKSISKQYRLLIQAKHNLVFSCKNDVFKQVITDFWIDFNKLDIFDKNTDKLLIVKSGLNDSERNHIKYLLNIVKTHPSESDFFSEINQVKIFKEKFDIFVDTLKEYDKTITEINVWDFIKCLDVLDYDFLNEPSTDKLNFLNMIRQSKNKTIQLNENEIWNSILAFISRLNYNGGSITRESLHNESFYSYFNLENIIPYYSSISKLMDNSNILLNLFKNNIDGFHIPREKYYDEIVNALQNNQITFITGEPGVGKSAIVKEFLYKMFGGRGVFSFRADQFNVTDLSTLLSTLGIYISVKELLTCISLLESKIIFIDGIEKLLEGEPLNAFLQLKNVITEYPEIKIIVTARRFSIELLCQKFDIKPEYTSFVVIDQFSKVELEKVSKEFPRLIPVLQNKKIRSLLSSPKYIEFVLFALDRTDEDFTNIDQIEFKTILWNKLVKNDLDRKNGLPKKREDAFIEIAVKRARSMRMFVQPVDADPVAIDLLENDNIIIQDNSLGIYSPAHDILEDWALTRYVSKVFDNYPSPHDLFVQLGNAPAIRRGFRLWVNDKLLSGINGISGLINSTLNDQSIERFWSDEMLLALLKSVDCGTFVNEYEKILLSDNLFLLNKCIHFIRIACKENLYADTQFQFFIPEGEIWKSIIFFIEKNISLLDNTKMTIIGLISDWESAFQFNRLNQKDILLSVRNIIIHYINQIEAGIFSSLRHDKEIQIFKQLISVLYNLAEVSNDYITALVKRAWVYKEKQGKHELIIFYNIVIEHCFFGEFPPSKLAKYMPDLVIEVAWKEWKLRPEKFTSYEGKYVIPIRRPFSHFEMWGIQNAMRFSPAGIFKTPFYFMLITNPVKAIKFIVAFLNYSVEYYVNSNTSEYKNDLSQIELELYDGSIIKQWSGESLWLAYRGLGNTNDLIVSLLISVEKYLLESASEETPSAQKEIKRFFEYILKNSNNIMLTSILASVSMAYPKNVGELMLPILKVKEFYHFDLVRSSREYSAPSPKDDKIPYAQEERHKFNELPHRKKYVRGLMNFIVDYQINIKTLNEKIFHIFDILKSRDDKSDELWTKTLTEIDIRNYYINEYDNNIGGYPLAVKYDESLNQNLANGKKIVEKHEITFNVAKIIDDAYKKENSIEYTQWLNCYTHYTNPETINKLYDKYATLAVVGLRDLETTLNDEQKNWCLDVLSRAVHEIINKEMNQAYLLEYSFNIVEENIVLSSLHYLLKSTKDKTKTNELLLLFVLLIIYASPVNMREILAPYIRNVFANAYSNELSLILTCLIGYSQFLFKNKEIYYKAYMEDANKLKEKEFSFIYSIIESGNLEFNTIIINFDHINHHILCRALTIIPYDKITEKYLLFMKIILERILTYLNKEKVYDQNYWSHSREERLNFEEFISIHSFTADILLFSDTEKAKEIINVLLEIPLSTANIQEETEEFVEEILNLLPLKLADEWNANPDSILYPIHFKNFWNLWEYLFKVIQEKSSSLFSNKLLFDIQYLCYDYLGRPYKKQHEIIKGKKDIYGEIVNVFGKGNLLAIMRVFTNIGMPSLFPDCINWIVDICKESEKDSEKLATNIAVTMVKKLFYHYMTDIAKDENILNNYIWLLDKMIDLGVSEAYFLRENVITFKTKEINPHEK